MEKWLLQYAVEILCTMSCRKKHIESRGIENDRQACRKY